jgi:hypothetical protein
MLCTTMNRLYYTLKKERKRQLKKTQEQIFMRPIFLVEKARKNQEINTNDFLPRRTQE